MTKKYLQDWYNSKDITYSEKERLNKIGVGNYDYHYLQDLEQILKCESWAKSSSEIRNKISGRIKKIIFFTPNFNDSKPDASNYSCAIITDGNNDNWAIVYRPSYVSGIRSDIIVKRIFNGDSETESKLNGYYPISALVSSYCDDDADDLITWPYIYKKELSSDAEYNPDKYILPLDIVKRPIEGRSDFSHFAIYLGNKQVAHLPGGGKPTQFDSWNTFCGSQQFF